MSPEFYRSAVSQWLSPFHPPRASLRCFVYQITKTADGKEERKQIVCQGPPKRPCSTDGIALDFDASGEATADAVVGKILNVIKPHVTKSDKAVALEIEGFLQFTDDKLPVIKLEQPLRLELQDKTGSPPDRSGANARPEPDAAFSTPFDSPTSSESGPATTSDSSKRFVAPWRRTSHSRESKGGKEGVMVRTQ